MRYIRYACIALFALALVLIALANRGMVTLRVLPDELSGFAALNPTYDLPLFVVIFGGILSGLILGFIWEWIREAGERAAAARQARELASLRAEVARLKKKDTREHDEVLALLDEAG
ncbi:lipopolysaccharide assembly protein LapA domain-containing protein [Roseovarius nitratireducens]|uniref:lipopolysaccharide assembly protein LapA domain-containing protein n=1 Tax=Roseovarius nitratireducens TaxID=2044597 RepID=UPI000CE19F96|nr:lipopolysaccharide assembly protein LapA domain-containing protein [Roseovarius nitratireducens]